jgi:pantoate--beta-alanine ligase
MNVRVLDTIPEARAAVAAARAAGKTVGLVPTMGALHRGHGALLEVARRETGFVVCSIFVNPTQFGPNEDFSRYPRTLPDDLSLSEQVGTDAVFVPSVAEMYHGGFATFVEVPALAQGLCGRSRPTHFRGVCTVVAKLFNIVTPDVAYFGEKDAQQVRILDRMARDLDLPLRVARVPIVREADGLALSSRNRYLDPDQRRQATVLSAALREAGERIAAGERQATAIRDGLVAKIATALLAELDYAEVVDGESLQPIERLAGSVLIALAVRFGSTRLIDNLSLTISD